MYKIYLIVIFFTVTSIKSYVYCQDKTIDDLKLLLTQTKNDSTKVLILSELVESAPEGEWELYNVKLKEITETQLANCKTKAICNYYKTYYATCIVNIGYLNMQQGVSDKALFYYLKGLKIYEELGNLSGIAETNNNIGYVFQQQKNFSKAQQFYEKSLKLFEKTKNIEGVATGCNNLGYIYKSQLKFKQALYSYNKAFTLYENIRDSSGMATSLNNIGKINLILGDTLASIDCYKRNSVFFEKTNDIEGLIFSLRNLSIIYKYTNKLNEALECADRAYVLSLKIGLTESIRDAAQLKYEIFKSKRQPLEALEMFEFYIKMRDSVLNENSQVSIIEQQAKYVQETETLKNEKKQVVLESEKQKQKIIIYSIILILVVVVAFSISLLSKFKLVSKQKSTIEFQRNEVEKQKKIIEEKQKDIQDSINYAKRIQNSFMASEETFKKNCNDYFVLFNPKDVVSGDFYWANSDLGKFYLCVADSTGHGIPGAFMSLLNLSLLNEALLSKNILDTSDILNFVRKILILGLKPDESGQGGNDGMDCSFVRIDFSKMELQFCGANNPLWIIRDGNLIEFTCDRMPVGRSPKQETSFTHQMFSIKNNDTIYMFTDGFADQFGGPKGRKYKYKQLKELLLSNVNESMSEQKEKLSSTIYSWRGNLEQVDDICVIGIKI